MILDIRPLKNCIFRYSKTGRSRASTLNFLPLFVIFCFETFCLFYFFGEIMSMWRCRFLKVWWVILPPFSFISSNINYFNLAEKLLFQIPGGSPVLLLCRWRLVDAPIGRIRADLNFGHIVVDILCAMKSP